MKIDKVSAAKELLARRRSQSNLEAFYKYTFNQFIEGNHIKLLCDALERVERGECKRLIVSMPPRHSKSETCSVRFPAWFLGRHPDKKVVLASYSQDMASEQSRNSKSVFYSKEYANIFPNITPSINSKEYKTSDKQWETVNRGSYFAVGVGGGLTGRGFDIGIIDDYVKDRADINSEGNREKILDWYKSTFYTRQSPNAAIIIVATRWAVDDLIGTLLGQEDGDEWEILSFPALDLEENALWPAQYPKEVLLQIKAVQGIFEWSALFQGEPTIRGGNRFKIDNLIQHNTLEEFPDCKYMRAWDLASSKKERNKSNPDFTVGILATVKRTPKFINEIWIKDIVFGQWEAPERDRIILQTAERDGPTTKVILEAFAAYKDAYNICKQILRGKRIVEKSQLPGDKEVKASPLEPIFEAKNVHILKGAWIPLFIKHFGEFPNGQHDDFVDALSIIIGEYVKEKAGILVYR